MDFLVERYSLCGSIREQGAKTLPARARPGAGFPPGGLWAAVLLLVAACAGPRENSVHRATHDRAVDGLRTAREQQARERRLLEVGIAEDELALRQLRDRAASAASRRRDVDRECRHELEQLQLAAAELAAARAQVEAQRTEIEALHAQVSAVATMELQVRALAERRTALDAQLAAAQAEVAAMEPRLADLQARLAQAKALDGEVQKALQAIAVPAAPPPAAPAPAGAPAK